MNFFTVLPMQSLSSAVQEVRSLQRWWLLALCLCMDLCFAAPQSGPPIVAVRELARYKAAVDQCTSSNFFKKLRKTDFTYWVLDINSDIDHVVNYIHDSSRGKMLFVTYNIALRQYSAQTNVPDACDKDRLTDISAKIPPISNAVRKFLRS